LSSGHPLPRTVLNTGWFTSISNTRTTAMCVPSFRPRV